MRLKAIIMALAVVCANPAYAKDMTTVVNLYGTTFSYAMPPWTQDPLKVFEETKFNRFNLGFLFGIQAIPATEDFKNFTRIYNVMAMADYKNILTFEKWQHTSLNLVNKSCKDSRTEVLKQSKNYILLRGLCPEIVNHVADGYTNGNGVVGIYALFDMGNHTFITHSMEWQSKRFKADDPASWPATPEDISKGLEAIKQARATVDGKTISYPEK